ncbi:DUF6531 domain-containing protein [Sorangium sp. So ce119]|uniref:DUF6531 domain-containing protein n=1 Tax=Sorangium sp. So ce119 TaxID=3133279 RepID=UPI003F5FFB8D
MARTAPFPNIPAIPGMNPGVFIMGGGAGSGGRGGPNGGAGQNRQGANGQNGGNDGQGGGRGANGCGQGSGAGCPNPAHGGGGGTAAGDPVDIADGRVFTIPQLDLVLPGPLLLLLHRSYSIVGARARCWPRSWVVPLSLSRNRGAPADDRGLSAERHDRRAAAP